MHLQQKAATAAVKPLSVSGSIEHDLADDFFFGSNAGSGKYMSIFKY